VASIVPEQLQIAPLETVQGLSF